MNVCSVRRSELSCRQYPRVHRSQPPPGRPALVHRQRVIPHLMIVSDTRADLTPNLTPGAS